MSNFKMSGFPSHKTGVQKKGSPVKFIGNNSEERGTSTVAAASGAMQGAQAGAMFGPYGMAIGAVVGGGAGLLMADKANKTAAEDKRKKAVALEGERRNTMKAEAIKSGEKRKQQAQVGVVDFSGQSGPPPAESTPIESSSANLGALYSPIQKVIKKSQKLRNVKY